MGKKWFYLVICVAASMFAGCGVFPYRARDVDIVVSPGFEESRLEKMVVDVSGDIEGETPAKQVEEFFEMELLRRGYHMVDRETVERLIETREYPYSLARARLRIRINDGRIGSMTCRIVDDSTADLLLTGVLSGGGRRVVEPDENGVLGGSGGRALSARTIRVLREDLKLLIDAFPAAESK